MVDILEALAIFGFRLVSIIIVIVSRHVKDLVGFRMVQTWTP